MEIFGIIILLLDIWAIVNVVGSSESITAKVLWSIGIVIFPLIGFVVWLLAGPRASRALA